MNNLYRAVSLWITCLMAETDSQSISDAGKLGLSPWTELSYLPKIPADDGPRMPCTATWKQAAKMLFNKPYLFKQNSLQNLLKFPSMVV